MTTALSNNLDERKAALQDSLQAVCARLTTDASAFGIATEAGPDLEKAAYDLIRDAFTGEYSLEVRWKGEQNNHRSGSIVFHPDGTFFAEYDVLVQHPAKPKWFVEAVTAWGKGESIKSEPRLLPMPEDDTPAPEPAANAAPAMPDDVRLVILHKHHTSARVRFLRLDKTVLGFAPLPAGDWLDDENAEPELLHHPATIARCACGVLGLENDKVRVDGAFRRTLSSGDRVISVLLAECTSNEPPFEAAEAAGARFVSITEVRDLPLIERELLRTAYEHVLG